MRGALKPLGVECVDLKADEKKFSVKFDAGKTSVDKILAALKTAGESAKKID